MSPAMLSGRDLQQFTPLFALTIRVGSSAFTALATLAVSYSPQPSLNTTQPMIEVTLRSWSTIADSSCSKFAFAAGTGSGAGPTGISSDTSSDGMSCQTISPSLSAQ